MKKRKIYSEEFKDEAAAMVTEHQRSIAEVCETLSIGETALRRWIRLRQSHGSAGNTSSNTMPSDEQKRIQALEKQVKVLEKERDLLKKSIACFARDIVL